MAAAEFPLFDADNHDYEPRDSITRYIEPRRRERAIHVENSQRLVSGMA